jgi:DNA-binding NtrC family response regulator
MREEVLRSLLLVDADPAERRMVSATASRAGWSVVSAACAETAAGLLQGPHGREVRASLLSSWDPETGPSLIAAMRAVRPELAVIVLAGGGSIDQAVDAMRAGASDFLAKPVAAERLLEALSAHRDRRRAAGELAPLSEKLAPELPLEELVGATPDFRTALAVAAKAARNRLPILIIGDPGTGKETSPAPSTPPRCAPAARSSRSTARRSPQTSSTAPCSDMSPALSRAPSRKKSEV